jgi:hypothetical protein
MQILCQVPSGVPRTEIDRNEQRKGRKNVTGVTEREMKENTGYRERGCTDGLKIL